MKRVTLKTVHTAAKNLEPFKCNETLIGEWKKSPGLTGIMNNPEDIKSYDSWFKTGYDVFVIKSYDTPIMAWNKSYGWWVSSNGYTQTTKRHLSSLRRMFY